MMGFEPVQISCFRVGFKIKKKSDIQEFLKCLGEGSWYYDRDDEYDWCIEKQRNSENYICVRHKSQRSNFFSPYVEVCMRSERDGEYYLPREEVVEKVIWRDRKYINKQIVK